MADDDNDPLATRIWVNDFDEADVRNLQRGIDQCVAEEQGFAPVFIDTCGGSVWGLGAMLDLIAVSPIPVATIAVGKALSAGAMLLAGGTKGLRFAGGSSTIMVHEMLVGHRPLKMPEYLANTAHSKRENDAMVRRLDKACGKAPGYWHGVIREGGNVDHYMDAKAAKAHGLVDFVGVPGLRVSTNRHVEMVFDWPKEAKAKRKKGARK